MSKKLSVLSILAAVTLVFAAWSLADAMATRQQTGKVGLKSIGALEFGPEGVLFVGDSQGAAVYAIDVGVPEPSSGPLTTVEDLDEKIASLLGTIVRDVAVQDMAVHQPSGTVYLSIMRGRGDGAAPVLVQVSRDGEIAEVRLDNVRYSRLDIPNAPAEDAKLYRWDSRTFTITDLEFVDGELLIAGLTNEEFASTLKRAPYPFRGELSVTGLEIYHGAHGEYETFAPIFSFVPHDIEGETHLLAGYLCTPLVTFPLDEIKTKEKLRGKTIAELGWGNIPTDLVTYEKDGEGYVLIVNSSRGNMRVKSSDIAAAQRRKGITTKAEPRTGVEDETLPLGNIAQAADFDADHIVVLGRSMENGSLYLRATPKRRL